MFTLYNNNDGGDDLVLSANGSFTFSTPLQDGASYSVTIQTQPASPDRVCQVSDGAGTVGGANVTSVQVTCVLNGIFANGFE